MRTWWDSFGPSARSARSGQANRELHIIVVRDEGRIIAIAPLMRETTVAYGLPVRRLAALANDHTPRTDFVIADKRVHHFVPDIVLALASGATSIGVRSKQLDRWLALPFGAGAALVLDEAALLLELDDVYWTEEGVLSLQVSFGAIGMLAAGALAVRLLRRGESSVGLTPAPAP